MGGRNDGAVKAMASGGRVHPAVITISAMLALGLLGDSLLYSVLPLYAEELGIPVIMVGWILSINRWIRLLSNPIAARTFDRFAVHGPVFFSSLGAAVSTAAYAFPLGSIGFLAARVVWGFAFSHFRLGGYLVVMRTSRSVMGLAMGVRQAVARMGSAFTVIAGGLLIDTLGYQNGMLLLAGASALGLPLTVFLRRQLHGTGVDLQETGTNRREQEVVRWTLAPWFCCGASFFTQLVSAGLVVSSLSVLLQERIGQSAQLAGLTLGIATIAGLVFSAHWLSALVLSPAAGWIADRLGRRRPFIAVTILQAAALFILAGVDWAAVTITSAVLFFVLSNFQRVLMDAAAADTAQGHDGARLISRYNSFQDLGAASGPILGYSLGAAVGFSTVYAAAALLVLAVAAVAVSRRAAG